MSDDNSVNFCVMSPRRSSVTISKQLQRVTGAELNNEVLLLAGFIIVAAQSKLVLLDGQHVDMYRSGSAVAAFMHTA